MTSASTSTPTERFLPNKQQQRPHTQSICFMSEEWNDSTSSDSNQWRSSDEQSSMNNPDNNNNDEQQEDWQAMLARREDGSFWQTFQASDDDSDIEGENPKSRDTTKTAAETEQDLVDANADAWLEQLASLTAEEVEFNLLEAERADKARQMQEWGFDTLTIANTLNVAIDDRLERTDDLAGMQSYRVASYLDTTDLKLVESHTMVEKDPETGEPLRQQMVYVDEHTCIGCTNCAMIAQSTFFMNDEHGRARVFQQWGDTEETIQIAIETCPVDCIHYIPYEELEKLEIDRRGQNINFKARLVSQGEYSGVHRVGGANAFTAPQKISGNMGSRCNNCPSRGCKNCPMFGVGQNPQFEKKEQERKARIERARVQRQREEDNKKTDL
jgi:ferredoxin